MQTVPRQGGVGSRIRPGPRGSWTTCFSPWASVPSPVEIITHTRRSCWVGEEERGEEPGAQSKCPSGVLWLCTPRVTPAWPLCLGPCWVRAPAPRRGCPIVLASVGGWVGADSRPAFSLQPATRAGRWPGKPAACR